jgi:phosphoglycerate dehydrogenase-like enzyme
VAATRLVLCYPVEAKHLAQIQAAAPTAEVVDAGQERIAEEIHHCDLFCGHPKVPIDWDRVVEQRQLKWIQSSAAGLDHCLVPSVVESEIIVTSASGVLADQVAEHTLALLLGLLRGLPTFFRAQQKGEFIRRPTRDLHFQTVGIVGLGGNGRRLVKVLAPWKVRILATDYFPYDKPPEVEELWPADRLIDLARQADILILAAPLTPATHGMIDRHVLGAMKRGSVLINVARGGLVVESDLVNALASGHLWGAAVDVTATEPLPTDSPLWELPNVIITPHVGGQFAHRIDQMTDFFCENLRRYLAGEPLNNLVDKRLGFPVRRSGFSG